MPGAVPTTMRQVTFAAPGPPDVLEVTPAQVPRPGPREVLIGVSHAGVNRPDCAQRAGHYPPPPGASPILGLEVAGEVVAVGPEVTAWRPGDLVCALTAGGGYAQYAVADDVLCLPIPTGLGPKDAAALPETFFTAWNNVVDRCRLAAGETLLVHGGAGGVGVAAIQLGKQLGATVYATVGTPEKVEFCLALGADAVFNYRLTDFVTEVAAHTGGRGVDVILDIVGGDYFARNLRCLAPDGRLAQIAFLHGPKVELNLAPLMLRRLTLTGSTLRASPLARKAEIAAALYARVWPLLDSGAIDPAVRQVLPMSQVVAAHELMESSGHLGKIVIATDS